MKNCAETDAPHDAAKTSKKPERRRGFVLIYILAVSAALITLLSLALNTVQRRAEEELAAARRLRIENIAAQASAAAEAWFYANAAAITHDVSFEADSAPENDPTPEIPAGIFSLLRELYHQYIIESLCYDLHYPDSFSERAYAARIPNIPPFADEEGAAFRAYYIRTTVTEAGDAKYKSAVTLSLRVKKSPSGIISAHRTAVME